MQQYMTAALPQAFPDSRALAGWWPGLAQWRPEAIWIAHLLLHHVDAPVTVCKAGTLDPFEAALLGVLCRSAQGSSFSDLQRFVPVGPQLASRVLNRLADRRLIARDGDAWRPTPLGLDAIARGRFEQPEEERRVFHFVELPHLPQAGAVPPQFLALADAECVPAEAGERWHFDPKWLSDCANQSLDWKGHRGFPLEVRDVLPLVPSSQSNGQTPPNQKLTEAHRSTAWQRIVLDRPERLSAAVVETKGAAGHTNLLAFRIRDQNRTLTWDKPVFTLGDGWQTILPVFAQATDSEAWRHAWRDWLRIHRLPSAAADVCSLRVEGVRARVDGPGPLLSQLAQGNEELRAGTAWLTAGAADVRRAARVVLGRDGADG